MKKILAGIVLWYYSVSIFMLISYSIYINFMDCYYYPTGGMYMSIKNVIFTDDATNDFINLPQHIQTECTEMIKKLSANINMGLSLENKNGRDLSDCFKIYFDNARYRIIYQKINNTANIQGIEICGKTIEKIAEVLGIGKRDGEYIYKLVASRIKK